MKHRFRPLDRPRGQPVLVFAALLGGWLILRVLLWQSPFASIAPAHSFTVAGTGTTAAALQPVLATAPEQRPELPRASAPAVPAADEARVFEPLPPPFAAVPVPAASLTASPLAEQRTPAKRIVGQHLLLAAAFSHMELPPEIAAFFGDARTTVRAASAAVTDRPLLGRTAVATADSRWSGDGWLLLRKDSASPVAAGRPAYGRSQAGAVLRYRLAPANRHRPEAFARVTRALAGPRETEVAVGLSARPLAGLPLRVAGELRVRDGAVGREARAAAFAVTELPPAKLPFGLRGEAYAQGGYVGGDFATAFADGQARVDGTVARLGSNAELRLGAGAWGGAQKHAARLDIGPSATVTFRIGESRSRLAVDYRLRVAGDAEPQNGPAVTLSAGF